MEENEKIEKNKNFFKIFLIYFVVLALFVAVRIASAFGLFDKLGNDIAIDLVSTAIIQILILFLVPFSLYLLLFKKKPKDIKKDFAFNKLSWKAILICFGIGVLAYILNIFISTTFSYILSIIGYNPQYSSSGYSYDTFPKFLIGVLSVAILPAICEEFAHRGLLLNGSAKSIGYKKAIILSSVMFGLMHLNVQQFFYATILGALMGLVVSMTKSIYPAMIIHFCNNFINVFSSYAESSKLFSFSISDIISSVANGNILLFFLLAAFVAFLCILGLIALIKKLFMETRGKEYAKQFDKIKAELKTDETITDSDVAYTFKNIVVPNMKTSNDAVEILVGDNKQYEAVEFKSKIPVICCIVLGALITIATFIWGVV